MRDCRDETCIGPFTGMDGSRWAQKRGWRCLSLRLRDWDMFTSLHPALISTTPSMAWHLQTSPGEGPSNPRSLPAVAHQVPGSDFDLASNDDMLLSAFDLTILPILGESEEHSHAEAPGRRQHHHRSGTYCGQWAHAYEHQVRWNLYLVTSTAQPYPGNMRSAAMVISPRYSYRECMPIISRHCQHEVVFSFIRPLVYGQCLQLATSMEHPSIYIRHLDRDKCLHLSLPHLSCLGCAYCP
ncbi:hypothetical protein LY78DRAFT_731503, partial [Colletotrichum sublineola]